jgi:hypothetical protein
MSAAFSGTTMSRRIAVILLIALTLPSRLHAQGSAGTGGGIESRTIVDKPTAGILHAGELALDLDLFENGGVLGGVSIGFLDRGMIGISYGGSGVIGGDDLTMNDVPGMQLRIRILDETRTVPAITLGLDTQGRGPYDPSQDRYTFKSPGVYAVVSKNMDFLGYLTLHAGANYSLETGDDDNDINGYLGADKTIGGAVSLTAEYDFAFNDNDHEARGEGRGYLNAGLRWSIGSGFTIGVVFQDLLENGGDNVVALRSLRLEYVTPL